MSRKRKISDQTVGMRTAATLLAEINFVPIEAALGYELSDDQRGEIDLALGFVIERVRSSRKPKRSSIQNASCSQRRRGRPRTSDDWRPLIETLQAVYHQVTGKIPTVSSSYERRRAGDKVSAGGKFVRFSESVFAQIPVELRPPLTALATLSKRSKYVIDSD